MPKKFFDIIPPVEEEKEDNIKEFSYNNVSEEKEVPKKKKKLKRIFFKSSLFLVVSFFVILIIGFFLFQKTEIEIYPVMERINLKREIVVDLNLKDVDFDLGAIPGQFFEDERFLEKTFSATGKAETKEKATGTITVYNEHSTSPRTLVPSRFISSDGKLFWSTDRITIPGAKEERGKLIPGEKEVKIEAAEPGEEYNIGATTFALPALAGTSLYTTIYAKSFSPMSGGVIGEVSMITKEDLQSAENSLVLEAKEESKDYLSKILPENFILPDQSVSQEIIEKSFSAEEGDLKDFFDFKVSIKSTGFSFSEKDLNDFIKDFIRSSIDSEKDFLEDSLTIDYHLDSIDLDDERLVLNLDIGASVFEKIDQENLKKALLGKSIKEAEIFLIGFSEMFDFSFKKKPFLRKNITEDINELEIYFNYKR